MTNKTIIVGFIALAFVAGTFGVQSAYAGVDPILQLQMAAVELRNAVLQNAQVIEGEIGARILNDQNQQEQIDSFFDVFVDAGELFQEVSDRQAADDALRTHIDTEIVALDLRGSSCDVNNVVTGVDIDGNLVCLPDTDSNAGTICISGQYLDGDGT